MLAEAQLALNASERHDAAATGAWLGEALAHGDDLRARAQRGDATRTSSTCSGWPPSCTVSMGANPRRGSAEAHRGRVGGDGGEAGAGAARVRAMVRDLWGSGEHGSGACAARAYAFAVAFRQLGRSLTLFHHAIRWGCFEKMSFAGVAIA